MGLADRRCGLAAERRPAAICRHLEGQVTSSSQSRNGSGELIRAISPDQILSA